jgi:hypothetical protein
MERKRKRPPSSGGATAKPDVFDLRPERAFVIHLDARSRPPRQVSGRVEHVVSGRAAHVASLEELLVFFAEVLRSQIRAERQRTEPSEKRR